MEKADLLFLFFVMEKVTGKLKWSSTPAWDQPACQLQGAELTPGSEKFSWNIALKGKALPWGNGDVEGGIDKQIY